MSVLLGTATGYSTPIDSAAGRIPLSIAAADFNGDGLMDVVCADELPQEGDYTISVLLGNGDGAFETLQTVLTEAGAIDATVGDFNNDGKPDIAASGGSGSGTEILLGSGDGSFHSNQILTPAYDVAVAGDFNHDGNLDLVSVNDGIEVFFGNGDGTFQSGVNYISDQGVNAIAVADLNSDGNLDLATIGGLTATLSIWLGNADGSFQPHTDYRAGNTPVAVLTGDFNGDGHVDVAVGNDLATS